MSMRYMQFSSVVLSIAVVRGTDALKDIVELPIIDVLIGMAPFRHSRKLSSMGVQSTFDPCQAAGHSIGVPVLFPDDLTMRIGGGRGRGIRMS